MAIIDVGQMYDFNRKLHIRSFSNCLFDFKNELFSKSLFDELCFELSESFYVITVDILNYSKLTKEQFEYVINKLSDIPHIKHLYNDGVCYHFRPAYQDDMCNLMPIFKENSFNNGGMLHCEEASPSVSNNKNIFLFEYYGERIGYVVLGEKNERHKDMNESILLQPINFNDSKFIYIKQCAISKKYQGKGFGTRMFNELFKNFPEYYFYSHVSVDNIQSLKLHYRSSFEKVGVYQSLNFHGDSKYFSDLVVRKI